MLEKPMEYAIASYLALNHYVLSAAIIASIATWLLTCCSTEAPRVANPAGTLAPPQSTMAEPPDTDTILGVWNGVTYVTNCFSAQPGRCGAQQIVTMKLMGRTNSTITGQYECYYGNRTCLGQNNSGKILAASLRGTLLSIRVSMPDGTSCLFDGWITNWVVNGAYSCYAGGAILEQGTWRSKHLY